MSPKSLRILTVVVAGSVWSIARPALAQPEVELANDGWTAGGVAHFQSGFVAGEIAAAHFVPEAPGDLLRIRLLFGGATGSQTVTVHVWDDAAGSVEPGIELYSNDFLLTASSDTMQDVELTDGAATRVSGPFRVGLEFQHSGPPGVARDDDGLDYPDRSLILMDGAGWTHAGTVGVTGDWIIRAVITGPDAADADADGDADAEVDAEADADVPAEAEAGADGDVADAPIEADAETSADSAAEADSTVGCVSNAECPAGQYCGSSGACTFDCRTDDDCPEASQACNSLGQCVASRSDGGGCGCRLAGSSIPSLLPLLVVVAALARRSRRRAPR